MEPAQSSVNIYRKMLTGAVSSILIDRGFDSSDKDALGTLTEMIQCFLCEVGTHTRNYCELSGRAEPLVADVLLAFVEMGYNFSDLMPYAIGMKHSVLPVLQPTHATKQLGMLAAGTKHPLPPYIPQHLPNFPDQHAYVRTPTHKQPIIDYESVREKAAVQKKDVEKALTKFLAKTSPTHNLFDTEEVNFALIAAKPTLPPYLSALMPQDQIFDQEDLEHDHKSQMMAQAKEQKAKEKAAEAEDDENNDENPNDSMKSDENLPASIDNPYLAATKLPKGEMET